MNAAPLNVANPNAANLNAAPEPEAGPEVVTDLSTELGAEPEAAPVRRPTLRVVRGDATPEEIAAILAVVAGRSTPAPEDRLTQSRSAWSDRALQLGAPPAPGPGAWRAAGKL